MFISALKWVGPKLGHAIKSTSLEVTILSMNRGPFAIDTANNPGLSTKSDSADGVRAVTTNTRMYVLSLLAV